MKKVFPFYFGLLLLVGASTVFYYGCKKKDSSSTETCSDGIKNQGETGVDCGGPCTACNVVVASPCTASLTNNKVTSSATAGLASLTTNINGSTVGASSPDGDIYIKIGGTIAEGSYPIEQSASPSAGKALIDFRPAYQGTFLSTAGTLYIDDTGTNFVIEFCAINCMNTSLTATAVTGRIVVHK